MANVPKAITDLPVASAMGDDDLLVVSQNATTSSIKGELIKGYAQNAVASQVTAAQTAANQAGQSATQAEAARQGAAAAQTAAENAQDAAETARDQSVAAAGTIGDSVEQAQTAAGQASSAKDAAVAAQTAAETAKTEAETASGQAQTAATQASGSATAAQTAATQAGDAKTDAETARNEAETSASSAANSASDAESAATEAEQAKTYIENMDMEGETLPAGSSVTVTKTTSPEGNLLFVIGVPQGIQGDKGDTGETGATGPQGVSVTNATVNEDGDLVITLSAGEPINAGSVIGPQGIQGDVGPTGASVDRIERTSGTGAPGTTDTYTVYLTDGQTGGTFQVYNGSNGTGSGDFMADGSVPMTGDLQMGGHKITNLAEPTDNADAASKEYVDDTITVSLVGNYIPMGQKGQANGVASLDDSGKVPSAQLPPMDYVPTSRTVNGHALSADVTLDADDVGAIPNPTGGTAGQVLTKTADGSAWESAPSGLPDGGVEGQMLYKSADGAVWGDKPVMWVKVTQSGNAADKTLSEIYQAYQNGYVVYCDIVNWGVLPLSGISDHRAVFFSTYSVGSSPDDIAGINADVVVIEDSGVSVTKKVELSSIFLENPSGGTTGQVLTKTSTGEEWSDAPSGLPEGGTEGQVIKKTADGAEWGNADWLPLSGGTVNGYINFDQANSGIYFSKFQDEHNCYPTIRSMTIDGKVVLSIYTNAHNGVDNTVHPIILSGVDTPKTFYDAANKNYVDGELNNFGAEISNELDTKLTTPTGTQGQLLGFTADNVVGAVDAPESGLTQEQADERYLQLTGGTVTGEVDMGQNPIRNVGTIFGGTAFAIRSGGSTTVDAFMLNISTSDGTYISGGLTSSSIDATNITVSNVGSGDTAVPNKAYVDSKAPLPPVPVTLTTSGWSSNTQTVTVSGVSATETAQLITPTPAIASQSAYYEAGIMCTGQAANSLTFTCQTVPTSNLTVYVVIQPLS